MTGLDTNGRYWHGVALFNEGAYFECHEMLEELWTAERGSDRLFLQSLIHFSVAFHHYGRNNIDGARRQLRKALKKLAGYLPAHAGMDTLALYQDGVQWRDALITGRPIE